MPDLNLPGAPTPVLILVGVFAAISLALLAAGLLAVARTPREHLPGGLSRVVWFLLCLVQVVGPLAFFVLRRRERRMVEETTPSQPKGAGNASIIDTLYG